MNPSELIAIARALVAGVIAGGAAPACQTELRRAISCAYYAMFHTLAASNANTLVGAGPEEQQSWAWRQAYRAVDHRPARNKLTRASLGNRFPAAIRAFGGLFAVMQQARHSADYAPQSVFQATAVIEIIDNVAAYINAFNQTDAAIRRDLAIHLITTVRSD